MIDYGNKFKILAGEFLANRVKFDCPISDVLEARNQFKAAAVFVAVDESELVKILDSSLELKIPVVVLTSGLKYKFRSSIKGLLVVDRTRQLKIVGIKGKVGGQGIGVEEASVEIASGENLNRLNDFLKSHGLEQVGAEDKEPLSVGERIKWDINLRSRVEKIKIWDQGQVYKCNIFELNKSRHVLLSVVIKMKAKKWKQA